MSVVSRCSKPDRTHLPKVTMALLCRGVTLVLFITVVALQIAIGKYLNVERSKTDGNYPLLDLLPLDAQDRNTLVFVHISDLHISTFTDSERYEQLKEFCRVNVKAIKPRLVLASGDLTDSIAKDKVIATQFEKEWQMYQELYTICQTESGIRDWLDLRGNHDNFNVNGYNSSNNYYPKFGSQRHQKPGSYMVTIEASNSTKYAFIGVDATLVVGPKRILNFIGELDDQRLSQLQQFEKSAKESNVNATVWFGHYPTSSIFSSGLLPGLRQVAANGIAYLCGHFHTFGGFVPRMYSHHHSGMLELELSDWKSNRMYRVGILDNGLFSFSDVQHNTWPVIVITNPKPLLTVQPTKEPVALMANSSHIRIFIFSPSPIEVCEVKLDDGPWQACHPTGDQHPLYTTAWQPELYAHGYHLLTVKARDSSGSERTSQIDFALDDSQPYFPFLARLTLMIDLTTVGQVLFLSSVICCIAPFFIIRYIQTRIIHRQMTFHRLRNRCLRLWLRKLWIFASIRSLLYPFVVYTVYLVVGPWCFGHLIDDRTGVMFAWGTFFEGGTYLAGTFSYVYGFIHVVTFNGLLIQVLAHAADLRYQESILKTSHSSTWKKMSKFVPICLFTTFHILLCYFFWLSYGNMATLINPMRTWSLLFAVILWIKATRLSEEDLRNVAKTWS